MAGPYRAPQVYPPVTFSNVDEVDLHYQAEQIAPPQTAVHNVDYQRRPGKRAWGHPEFWNESGTGDMLFTTLFQMVMRGADGVGVSSGIPPWGYQMGDDPRNTSAGIPTAFRACNRLLAQYGNWCMTLKNCDSIAIPVSGRMARIDQWGGIGGQHFTRLYEAYNACLYALYPASFVYVEDMKPDTLAQYKAVLLIDQRVELEPALADALAQARKAGVRIFADGTCRSELLTGVTPLALSCNRVEKDPSVWQDDGAYYRFPQYFRAHAQVLRQALAPVCPPVAEVENPEILLSARSSGAGRFLFLVNNTMLDMPPALLWRMNMYIANRLPLVAPVKFPASAGAVYDVFALRQVAYPMPGRWQ